MSDTEQLTPRHELDTDEDDGSRTPPRREGTAVPQQRPEGRPPPLFDEPQPQPQPDATHTVKVEKMASEDEAGGLDKPPAEAKKPSFFQKWRFEILVFFGTITLLGAVAVMFSQFIGQSFKYHNECLACLKQSGWVFDQQLGRCEIYNDISGTIDLNRYVVDADYCGAPECAKLEIMRGVRPVPYWVMVASSLIGIFTSAMVNLFKMFIVVPLRRRYSKSYTEDPLSAITDDVVRRFLLTTRILGAMDWYYYLGLYMIAHVHFFIIIHEVHSSAGPDMSTWDMYTKEYLLWVNSGTIQVLGYSWCQSSLWLVMKQQQRELPPLPENCVQPMENLVNSMIIPMSRHPFAAFVIHYLPFFVIPVFWTHVVPGLIVYSPLTAFLAVVYLVPGLLSMAFGRMGTLKGVLLLILMRVACNSATVSLFQTQVNFMTLLYQGHNWLDVPAMEYNSRSGKCYAAALTNKLQLYNIGFAGLILS